MIPFFRGFGAPGSTVDTQVSVVVPSGVQAGDTVIAAIAVASSTVTVTTPSGWTALPLVTSGGFRVATFRRVATSSEGSFYTFHASATVGLVALAVAYAGVDTSAPVDVQGSATATSTTATAPSVTTSGAERMVVTVTAGLASTTVSTPAGATTRTDVTGAGTGVPSIRLADFLQAAAGATGNKTSTLGTSTNNVGIQIALKPANLAPNAPTLTAPVGGASFDRTAAKTFTWTISDPDVGDTQSAYDLQYRLVGGSSWTTVSATTSTASRTFAGYTFPAGNYEWQVRTYDSHGEVGPWSSSGLFTASTPPPNAPTLTAPPVGAIIDRTSTQRFSWAFSDSVVGESQSQFDLQYRVTGTSTWTTVTGATPNQFVDAAGGTFPADDYEWQVRTYDSHGQAGPWSPSSFFTAADPPAGPVITSPVNDELINATPVTVTWSTPDQASYQVRRVADLAGAADTSTVYFDTGEVTGATARSLDVDFPVSDRTEHLQLRIRDGAGFLSPWTDVRVSTSYELPHAPALILDTDDETATITLIITNGTAGTGEVASSYNNIYRRTDPTDDTGIRLATAVPLDTNWTDRTPASGVDYGYQVIAIGVNGLGSASGWRTSALPHDPDAYPGLDIFPSLSRFPEG